MEVYFGGAFQGKLDYVLKKKGNLMRSQAELCRWNEKTGFTGKLSDVCCVRQWQNPTG